MKTTLIFITVVSNFLALALHAQSKSDKPIAYPSNVRLEKVGTLPKFLKEASGLEITTPGHLWSHNDDRLPVLYCLDTIGNVIKTIHLNHPNNGWEDLTLDKKGNLYIGAFGNNENKRKDLRIYKVVQPELIDQQVYTAEIIDFHYEDQHAFPPPESDLNFDADAFVSLGDSLFLFTKNRTEPYTGYTRVYRLPNLPGNHKALLYDSIYLGKGPMMASWVTSADLSPDEKSLVLLSHDCIWLVSDFKGKRFSSGKIIKVNLGHLSHKAGISFSSDTKLYIVDELEFGLIGGNVYSLDLSPVLRQPITRKK